MNRYILLMSACMLLSSCRSAEPPPETPPVSAIPNFNIDADRITVSGISSGAYMAGQLHLAHSATIGGAALLAGGPYYCAEGSIQKGLGPCIKGGDTGLDTLAKYAADSAASGNVDSLDGLAGDRVWLFHGALDEVVHADVVVAAGALYRKLSDIEPVLVDDVAVVHGMPTIDKGAACDEFKAPYLNACIYDAAGALLAELDSPLNDRANASGELRQIDQPNFDEAEMLEKAYLYVPASCAASEPCGVHIAFHGCLQSSAFVGDAFARDAGYNEWAESNHLLVLYPQVGSSKMAPMNPNGCWDWWGYTGEDYATKSGLQIAAVMTMIESLSATSQ